MSPGRGARLLRTTTEVDKAMACIAVAGTEAEGRRWRGRSPGEAQPAPILLAGAPDVTAAQMVVDQAE